jgi:hypothetical protein
VRTRTLLLLAIGCGLVILVAGVVQLLRIAGQDDPPAAAALGQPVRVGDMTVTVADVREDGTSATVTIEIGGVDDPDGSDEFRLVVPGESLAPDPDSGEQACGATTVASQRCTLTFELGDAGGSSRVLLYRRGDERARWELAGGTR